MNYRREHILLLLLPLLGFAVLSGAGRHQHSTRPAAARAILGRQRINNMANVQVTVGGAAVTLAIATAGAAPNTVAPAAGQFSIVNSAGVAIVSGTVGNATPVTAGNVTAGTVSGSTIVNGASMSNLSVQALSGLAAGTNYAAQETNPAGTQTAYTLFDVVGGVPTAPAAPTVTGVTATSAQVAIPALAGGATSYNLQRAPDNAGSPGAFVTIASAVAPGANYPDTLQPSTGYYYQLVAVNGNGTTTGAATAKITTLIQRVNMRRATIFQGLQLAAEPVAGQITPATVRILSLQCEPDANTPIKTDRLMGTKSFTATQAGKEHTTSKISGYLDFNAIIYLLASQVGLPAAPTALAGGAYQWNFRLDDINPASPQTYTAEVGNGSAASRFGYGTVDGFSIKHAKEDASVDGTMFGQAIADNILMTQNVAELPVVAAPFKLARISMGLTPGGVTKLLGSISGEVRMNTHWKPVFFEDDGQPSFSGIVETNPDYGMQIVTEMNSDADALLSDLRADQLVYVQQQWTGPLIAAGTPNIYHLLQVMMPVKITKQTRGNQDDVYGATFDCVAAHDPVFGTVQATVINKRSIL